MVTDVADPGLELIKTRSWCHVSRVLADGSLKCVGTGWINDISIQAQDEDLVSFDVICSPRDWDTHQAAALAPLKVLPAFDPVLVDPANRDDPVEILDGYSRQVHCHPVTHAFTVVDIFGVGLPVVEIADPDFPGPRPEVTTRPVARVDVTVSAEWIETRDGLLLVSQVAENEFEQGRANTLTPAAFEASFPKVDSSINGDSGYTVRRAALTRREDLDPEIYEPTMGPARGSSGIYNYVLDGDLMAPEPQDLQLERAWYDLELDIAWKVRQKRIERISFSILNGAPSAVGGRIEKLDLKTEDITIDDETPLWEPGVIYYVDDVRRVGSRNWRCTREHLSLGNFGADLFYSLGGGLGYGQQWEMEPLDASPLGSRAAISYFQTDRGMQTVHAAALKARAILAASIRNRPYRIETELTDDLLDLTTAHVVRVASPDEPSGWLKAKVIEIEINSDADDESVVITIAPAAGSGAPVSGQVLTETDIS